MPSILTVQAFTATLGHPEIETEDTAAANLVFSNGALGIVYGTTASFPGQAARVEISGTKGAVILSEESFTVWQFANATEKDEEIRQRFSLSAVKSPTSDPSDIPFENHRRNIKAFLDAVESGEDFSISGAEARKSVALILAIYESAKKGKTIQFK